MTNYACWSQRFLGDWPICLLRSLCGNGFRPGHHSDELHDCHPQEKNLLRVIQNIIIWKGVNVLQREEVSGYRVKRGGKPTLCPAIRSLPYVRYSVTPQKLCRGTASPDMETQWPGAVVLGATAASPLPHVFSALISVTHVSSFFHLISLVQ